MRIHRGYVYYLTNDGGTIPGKEDTTKSKYTLSRFSLEKSGDEVEVIHEGKVSTERLRDYFVMGTMSFTLFSIIWMQPCNHSRKNSYRYDIVDEKSR